MGWTVEDGIDTLLAISDVVEGVVGRLKCPRSDATQSTPPCMVRACGSSLGPYPCEIILSIFLSQDLPARLLRRDRFGVFHRRTPSQ